MSNVTPKISEVMGSGNQKTPWKLDMSPKIMQYFNRKIHLPTVRFSWFSGGSWFWGPTLYQQIDPRHGAWSLHVAAVATGQQASRDEQRNARNRPWAVLHRWPTSWDTLREGSEFWNLSIILSWIFFSVNHSVSIIPKTLYIYKRTLPFSLSITRGITVWHEKLAQETLEWLVNLPPLRYPPGK